RCSTRRWPSASWARRASRLSRRIDEPEMTTRAERVGAGLAALAYAALALAGLNRPGLNYDEVMFANAALGGYDPSFIPVRLGPLPLMVFPYLGALKAWLFWPIFALVPINAWTVRLPMVAVGVATLLLSACAATRLFDGTVAVVCIWLLALDPSFIFMGAFDWGPVGIALLLRAASLCLFASWCENGSKSRLFALGGVLLLGIFDKLNFVWFANGILAAALVARTDNVRS